MVRRALEILKSFEEKGRQIAPGKPQADSPGPGYGSAIMKRAGLEAIKAAGLGEAGSYPGGERIAAGI